MIITKITVLSYQTFQRDTSMKTPQQTYPELNDALGTEVYLKREDLHKYKSHKGRSIPLMIKKYAKEGVTHFVISSSGNAAIAAGLGVENHNRNNPDRQVTLDIFIGQHIDEKKKTVLERELTSDHITIKQVERPKQEAFQMDKEGKATFLRQSTDDLALEGYEGLAKDLSKIPNLQAVFIPTSSGTTALALAQSFKLMEKQIQVHVVQTTAVHPIAEVFDSNGNTDTSAAGAIVDKVAHRKDAVIEAIQESKGHGWIVTDEQIKNARKIVRDTTKVDISPNSALAVAGLQKALENNWKWDGPIVCVITGA